MVPPTVRRTYLIQFIETNANISWNALVVHPEGCFTNFLKALLIQSCWQPWLAITPLPKGPSQCIFPWCPHLPSGHTFWTNSCKVQGKLQHVLSSKSIVMSLFSSQLVFVSMYVCAWEGDGVFTAHKCLDGQDLAKEWRNKIHAKK